MSDDPLRQEVRKLSDWEIDQVKTVKGMGYRFHTYLDSLTPSREVSLAKTKVEEAVMWAVKGITGP